MSKLLETSDLKEEDLLSDCKSDAWTTACREEACGTYTVNLVGKVSVSPFRPQCVLANGVATVFSAPARIMMKNEYLVASEIIKEWLQCTKRTTLTKNQEVVVLWTILLLPSTISLHTVCFSLPGLLAVEQTKSALRGRRSSCRVTEPLEAEMLG